MLKRPQSTRPTPSLPRPRPNILGFYSSLEFVLVCTLGVLEPRIVIVNSSAIDIFWFKPTTPNGLVSTYRLYRSNNAVDSLLLYSGQPDVYTVLDSTVEPGVQYRYLLEVGNAAGATNSSWVTVTVPEVTPDSVPAITNISALSSESIYIAWEHFLNSSIDQYRVLVNVESLTDQSEWPASSTSTSIVVTGLRPYTWYSARLAACIRGASNGCGTNPVSEHIRTWEAPPEDQLPPSLTSTAPTTVVVSWQPPLSKNGLILLYRIRRREWVHSSSAVSEPGVLINVVNGSVNVFINVGIDLRPFTVYQYSITAVNSQGEATSNWTDVRTMEAAPQGILPPIVSSVGRYNFFVMIRPPTRPNGQIRRYELEYGVVRASHNINDIRTLYVSATTHNTSVSGVQPYTNHAVRVLVVNSAGAEVSGWTNFTTLPASPSGLSTMSIEPVSGGRSAILSWSTPTQLNGRILSYAVYSNTASNAPVYDGVNQQFELVGLEPYTTYSVQLKVCTVAGCTRSPWQQFTTLQAPPVYERTPSVGYINDSAVLIAWSRPESTFGNILSYELLRRTLPVAASASGRTRRSEVQRETIFTTTNTTSSHFSYLDTTVLPFTR